MVSVSRHTKTGLLSGSLQVGQSACNGVHVVLSSLRRLESRFRSILLRRCDIKNVVPDVELEVGPRIDRLRTGRRTLGLRWWRRLVWTRLLGRRVPRASRRSLTRNGRSVLLVSALASEGTVAEESTSLLLLLFVTRAWQRRAVCWFGRRLLGLDWHLRLCTGHGRGVRHFTLRVPTGRPVGACC